MHLNNNNQPECTFSIEMAFSSFMCPQKCLKDYEHSFFYNNKIAKYLYHMLSPQVGHIKRNMNLDSYMLYFCSTTEKLMQPSH